MKVNIVEYDEEKEITLEIEGEGHTFTNIKAAPKKKIDKAVRAATRELIKTADEFYKLLEKTMA